MSAEQSFAYATLDRAMRVGLVACDNLRDELASANKELALAARQSPESANALEKVEVK